jgi:hypothetical protein
MKRQEWSIRTGGRGFTDQDSPRAPCHRHRLVMLPRATLTPTSQPPK